VSTQQRRVDTSRTLNGSNGSGGGGLASVLTAQNMHPRVHVSPSSMIVPVPPFQHSPMFGHCASSHTVCKFKFCKLSFTLAYRLSLAVFTSDGNEAHEEHENR
jgi:hypothetical protein